MVTMRARISEVVAAVQFACWRAQTAVRIRVGSWLFALSLKVTGPLSLQQAHELHGPADDETVEELRGRLAASDLVVHALALQLEPRSPEALAAAVRVSLDEVRAIAAMLPPPPRPQTRLHGRTIPLEHIAQRNGG